MKSTIALALALFVTGCTNPCKVYHCKDLVTDSSLTSNNKDYTKCFYCDSSGSCETVLHADDGTTFFDCTDSATKSCTEDSVNAQFAYCDVQ
jgi:hypothetical protein